MTGSRASVREAVILVGGAGTRLSGVSAGQPKPMLAICGRPFLEWLLIALERQGVHRVVLSSGYKADVIEDWFGARFRSLQLVHSREETPLGTGGGLRVALPALETSRVFVLNGDSYCRFDCSAMERLQERTRSPVVIWLVRVPDASRFGAVVTNEEGRVTRFQEKGVSGPASINAGVYLFERSTIAAIPTGKPVSLERSVLAGHLSEGVYGVVGDDLFVDIGTPESLALASSVLASEFHNLS